MKRGLLVETATLDPATLEHERVPFITYAHERPFTLLKRAALLHLDLMLELIGAGFSLQDADPSNVQFFGGRPVFIDVTSITPAVSMAAWPAFSQFCDTMLYPLLLESHIGLDWRPWLRMSPSGIDVYTVSKILGLRRFTSPLARTHVVLRALLERAGASMSPQEMVAVAAGASEAPGFRRMFERLRRTIEGLQPASAARTVWGDYEKDCHYEDAATARKLAAVNEAVERLPPTSMVIDLGANAGRFSHEVALAGHYAVAIDGAADAVESMARATSATERGCLLPVVMDLANPSPDQGWAGRQYAGLGTRGGRTELVMALAVIHHLRVAANVPFTHQMEWFASLAPRLLVEYVAPEDVKAKELLSRRLCSYPDYDQTGFEAALASHYRIEKITSITPTRQLYELSRLNATESR